MCLNIWNIPDISEYFEDGDKDCDWEEREDPWQGGRRVAEVGAGDKYTCGEM